MKSGTFQGLGRSNWVIVSVALTLLFASTLASNAHAEDPPMAEPESAEQAAPAGSAAPEPTHWDWQAGPKRVDLGHELEIDLPEQYGYLANPDAKKLMEKMGNLWNDDLVGLIAPKGDGNWLVVLRYVEEGYVKDDEKIDADELLTSMKDGTEEGNDERVKRGFKAMHVDGWSEAPHYEKASHHFIWAINGHDDDGTSVNYNTRILGRRGYISVNLITDPNTLAADRPNATTLLAATHFRSGARYEDFDSKTDKVAEYGLAGLVLAGAGLGALKLVKLGLLAKFSKVIIGLLIAGKKLIIGAAIAIGAGLKALFKKRAPQQS